MQGLNNRLSFSIDLSSFGEYYFCVADGEAAGEHRNGFLGHGDITLCQRREERTGNWHG